MKIKALASIIEFDNGQMIVLNTGDEGELSEALALQNIAAGQAEEVKPKKKGKAVEPAPVEDIPVDGDEDGAPV